MTSAAAAVDEIIEPWSKACVDGDWDAIMSMCNDDMVFMPPGDTAKSGNDIRAWLETLDIKKISWTVGELHEAGDVAYLRGPVVQTLVIDGQPQEFQGKYCDIVRRGDDGKWRFSLVMWNSDAPAP